jgi:Zn-dependent protease
VHSAGSFQLFGFPVHVRRGFILFIALVFLVNSSALDYAIWITVFLSLFTLIHELGHAFAARATGARAEIALDFLYGYASFMPTRKLTRWERAGISAAGPSAQIVASTVPLMAMGVNPLSAASVVNAGYLEQALWFAGPVIGVFNLIPVLPFDGGNIALMGVDRLMPGGSARRTMIIASIALTIAAVVGLSLFAPREWRTVSVFLALPLISQIQMLNGLRDDDQRAAAMRRRLDAIRNEAHGWQRNEFPPPGSAALSPWLSAHLLHLGGDDARARHAVVASLTQPEDAHSTGWPPPDGATEAQLEPLLALLPRPLPSGNLYGEFVLTDVLARLGDYSTLAHYASERYREHRQPLLAVQVARAAAALGDEGTAVSWVRTALLDDPESLLVREAILNSPELEPVRNRDGLRDLVS